MNHLEIQAVHQFCNLPEVSQIQQWIDAVLQDYQRDTEIVLRIVDEQESAALNQQYRNKSGPTNILSFPADLPDEIELEAELLGDLLVCAPVLEREALVQRKSLADHWAHIVVHGVLHLLGYDHIDADDAEKMEALEVEILQQFNIPNPYLETNAA